MSKVPMILIAAGGTGGHMFPAQALAEVMLRRGWRVVLSTDVRGEHYASNFPARVEVRQVLSDTFARGRGLAKFLVPLTLLRGVSAAVHQFRQDPPDMVVGFGGYPSMPALAAAVILRLPRIIHEQNGVLGRVNRLFARYVSAIACGTWPLALPKGVKSIHIGNPVRDAILMRAASGYIPPGDHPMSLLVIGGSQGARILSQVVPAAIALMPGNLRALVRVDHQARAEDVELVKQTYHAAAVTADVSPFFDDVARRLTEAQLVITRAGASSIADISVMGRPSILIPYAAAAMDHQTANAKTVVDAGAGVALVEAGLTPERLCAEIMAILQDPSLAVRMAGFAKGYGIPDATQRLMALVEHFRKK